MLTYSPRQRLFVDSPLAAGTDVVLEADQAHYLVNVMRLGAGAAVALFNGRDGEWAAVIAAVAKRGCTLRVEQLLRPQAAGSDLWLLFAPVKGPRTDFIAEKATELGVSLLQPVLTRRTVANRVNVERLAANAREAAEQCERLTVPEVRDLVPLETILGQWPAERRLMFCDETGVSPPAPRVLTGLPRGPWAVLIGPEGGFGPEELIAVKAMKNAIPVGLGPRILRADTAAVAALTLWQAALGDLN